MSKWTRARSLVARVGHGVFYAAMTCLFAMAVAIGVATWKDRDLPTYSGTFTEKSTHCDSAYGARKACTSTGTWVSDDGKTTLHNVTLDGSVASHGTVRATYKPGGAMGANDVVHEPTRTHPELWLPWALAAVIVAFIAGARSRWRGRGEEEPAPVE